MSVITKKDLRSLGYNFVLPEYLPTGQDEYYLRHQQHSSPHHYRSLTPEEIRQLKANNNYSSDWSNVWVTDIFDPNQIHSSQFYGLIRIGHLSSIYLEYRHLKLACGIYNSQIISSDIGDDVAIHNVRFMSHFIIRDSVILFNINEMETSDNAKFGNGILKDGDDPERRIWLELCNENGGRSVLPFEGMQATDAYLWTRYRQDDLLQRRFVEITESKFDRKRGYYSEIGTHVVLKNANIIKDVRIGAHAYIKGVNKLKNVTINSSCDAYTQIGEGCELVNGIIGYGCRIFYGVKAVRFILSSFSQLKYGARLINSFLGDNSTISCCEVLNSLLFPAHEQHHNNSFLCAALVKGQSNMAAGATIGSNHNSRAADGEIIAERGFWPGLCVSIKHNSVFASYTLLVKGDFRNELHIRIPFSLVSNDTSQDRLQIIPGYWFLYNMYALMRNTSKFASRDRRKYKNQHYEYEILAPDTINEMFIGIKELEYAVGKAFANEASTEDYRHMGRTILLSARDLQTKEIFLENVENSKRKVIVFKARESYIMFRRMIRYYAALQVVSYCTEHDKGLEMLLQDIKYFPTERCKIENIGGQLVPENDINLLIEHIKSYRVESWDAIHQYYHKWSKEYPTNKLKHAVSALAEICERPLDTWNIAFLHEIIQESVLTKAWICQAIYDSRAKDYQNHFKQLVYNSAEEMDTVIGSLSENTFITNQNEEYLNYKKLTAKLITLT